MFTTARTFKDAASRCAKVRNGYLVAYNTGAAPRDHILGQHAEWHSNQVEPDMNLHITAMHVHGPKEALLWCGCRRGADGGGVIL
jgi:hypothetical protein